MNDHDFLKQIKSLNKTRKELLDDLFEDDNIEKAEKIDQDILELKNKYFHDILKWEAFDIKIENFSSIHPSHTEKIYLPEKLSFYLEFNSFKAFFNLNDTSLLDNEYLESDIIITHQEKKLITINEKTKEIQDLYLPNIIKTLEIKTDHSFFYVFINSLEVFKTLKPSDAYSISL